MTDGGDRVRVRAFVIASVLVAGSVACGHHQPAPLVVTWRQSAGHPACTYDAAAHAVAVKLIVTGDAGRSAAVTVTVTAYADENTSEPVGATTRRVPVQGTMHQPMNLQIAVAKAPHVDEDGVAACRLAVAGIR